MPSTKEYTKALYKYTNMLTQIMFYFRLKKHKLFDFKYQRDFLFIKEKVLKYLG